MTSINLMTTGQKPKRDATGKNWTVAIYDDRAPGFPTLALRNVRIASATAITAEEASQRALSKTYLDAKIQAEHCTRTQVYPADDKGWVIDGDTYTPFLFRENAQHDSENKPKREEPKSNVKSELGA